MKYAKDPASVLPILEKILNDSQEMIQTLRGMVWTINPDNDRAADFVDKIRAFADTMPVSYTHLDVYKRQGEGYIHGTVIKKVNDSVTDVGRGEYTTCDLEDHPHFSLKFTKAKVMSGNMIVTGPAWISIEGVPFPIGLPFGLVPNKKGRSSGLIIPRYGDCLLYTSRCV